MGFLQTSKLNLAFKIWQSKLIETTFRTSVAWGSDTFKYSDHGRMEFAKIIGKENLKKNNGCIKTGERWDWEQTGILRTVTRGRYSKFYNLPPTKMILPCGKHAKQKDCQKK